MKRQIQWTHHVTKRLKQRSLNSDLLLEAMPSLEIVESYLDDKYLPSFLLREEVKMYVPSSLEWDADCRIRRVQL